MDHKFKMHRKSISCLLCIGLALLIGCSKESPTKPQKGIKDDHVLIGDWQFYFYASNPSSCPDLPVTEGCSGSGELQFIQLDNSLQGSSSFRYACQTCGLTLEWGGSGLLEDFEVSESNFSFSIATLRFTAPLPDQEQNQVSGVVTCKLEIDFEVNGIWRMIKTQ